MEAAKIACRNTHGREFLLLLDKEVLKQCLRIDKRGGVGFWIQLMAFQIAIFIPPVYRAYGSDSFGRMVLAALAGYLLLNLMTLVIVPMASRSRVLLPAYRKRLLAKAQSALDTAVKDFNDSLPEPRYRVHMLPIVSPDSVSQLRTMAKEGYLTSELEERLSRVEVATAQLEAMCGDGGNNADH